MNEAIRKRRWTVVYIWEGDNQSGVSHEVAHSAERAVEGLKKRDGGHGRIGVVAVFPGHLKDASEPPESRDYD